MPRWTGHDEAMLRFYSQFLAAGDLCFDVGANLGNRTRIFLELGARVVAIEPQEQCLGELRNRYGRNPRLHLSPMAVGESAGTAQLQIGEANTLSSMVPEWVDAVQRSGRFEDYSWTSTQTVTVTTLDALCAEYGVPAFVKIDVEGFEYQVLRGLSRPISALSFEFVPEYLQGAASCVERVHELGPYAWNYSLGETMRLALSQWVGADELMTRLEHLSSESALPFGDVYAQHRPGSSASTDQR